MSGLYLNPQIEKLRTSIDFGVTKNTIFSSAKKQPVPAWLLRIHPGRGPRWTWAAHIDWNPPLSGWWLSHLPLCKIWVSWDDEIPNWMESHQIHVPNHQPDISVSRIDSCPGWKLCHSQRVTKKWKHGRKNEGKMNQINQNCYSGKWAGQLWQLNIA